MRRREWNTFNGSIQIEIVSDKNNANEKKSQRDKTQHKNDIEWARIGACPKSNSDRVESKPEHENLRKNRYILKGDVR